MRRAAAAAIVIGVCLSSTACTDDSGGVTPPLSTDTTATSDPPTTSASTDGPPALPKAAKAKTTAGAKAFVRYYVDVLNYSYMQQDAAAISVASEPNCSICNSIRKNIRRLAAQGGRQIGGRWVLTQVRTLGSPTILKRIMIAKIRIQAGRSRPSSRSVYRPIHRSDQFYEWHLTWSNHAWRLNDLRSA